MHKCEAPNSTSLHPHDDGRKPPDPAQVGEDIEPPVRGVEVHGKIAAKQSEKAAENTHHYRLNQGFLPLFASLTVWKRLSQLVPSGNPRPHF